MALFMHIRPCDSTYAYSGGETIGQTGCRPAVKQIVYMRCRGYTSKRELVKHIYKAT